MTMRSAVVSVISIRRLSFSRSRALRVHIACCRIGHCISLFPCRSTTCTHHRRSPNSFWNFSIWQSRRFQSSRSVRLFKSDFESKRWNFEFKPGCSAIHFLLASKFISGFFWSSAAFRWNDFTFPTPSRAPTPRQSNPINSFRGSSSFCFRDSELKVSLFVCEVPKQTQKRHE